jgi:hypothetical protein
MPPQILNPILLCSSIAVAKLYIQRLFMSNLPEQDNSGDSKADAIAVVAVLLIVMTAVVYWLSGM